MAVKLAVFDMDGTILDTLGDLCDSLNYVLAKQGYPVRTLDEVRSFVGNGIAKLIERAVPCDCTKEQTLRVYEEFIPYYREHCAEKTKPYDGIVKLLSDLKQNGIWLAVVSNKADAAVQDLCKQYFKGLFDIAVGECPGMEKKPAPDAVNLVLDKLHISREEAVYIGDSEVDIATAVNSGLQLCVVDWGFRDVDFLKAHGAKRIFSDTESLKEYLITA